MHFAPFHRAISRWVLVSASLPAVSASLVTAGCAPGMPGNEPKSVEVRFGAFDVGTDDCEDIFSFGDFTVQMSVTIQPGNDLAFATNRVLELGSAAFQAPVQSADLNETATFALQPGESFEVKILVAEDDPIGSDEPQPWEDSESFDFLSVTTESLSFTNGPGCFRDDRVDITVTVPK